MHQNTADTASPVQEGDTKMAQCNRELMALKSVNRAEYAHYHTEMNSLVASGRVYMGVRGTVSQDINDIVEPGYQYGTAKLCWRIRNSLAQSLIRQADAGTGRTQ
ncbi:hypothetical protein KMW40_24735 [Enterobacter cloacae]|uniref:hypothetical protein n=2 Tax=Enterobacter cloacae TaxID=550 RepID=UPI0034BDA780